MNKKIALTVILIALVALLAACGGSSNDGNNGAAGNNTSGAGTSQPASTDPDTSDADGTEAEGETEAEEMEITHQLGVETVVKNPQKVVVFDYGTLDTLSKLGVEVSAVPQGGIPAYLSAYEDEKYVNAGTLFEPDFEALKELDPDVIFISGRTSAVYDQLKEIAPTVYTGVDTTNYIESYKTNLTMLGELFGKEAEIEAEIADLDARIEALQAKTKDAGKGLIVLTTGGKVSAYGPGSRFGIIHDVFGVPAVDDTIEVETHGLSISFEYILEKNPDYLFVVDRDAVVEGGGQTAKDVIENALVQNTTAYKEGNIAYLNPEFWYLSGGGLISVSEMLNEIEQAYN